MQKIPLKLATVGMKLARPVQSEKGIMLVAQGTELTDSIIARLRGLDVQQIVVEGEVDGLGDAAHGIFARRLERLDHLFRKFDDDPFMFRLKRKLHQFFEIKAAQSNEDEDTQ